MDDDFELSPAIRIALGFARKGTKAAALAGLEALALTGSPQMRCDALLECLRLTRNGRSFSRYVQKWQQAPPVDRCARLWHEVLTLGLRTPRAEQLALAERVRVPGERSLYLYGCAAESRETRIDALFRASVTTKEPLMWSAVSRLLSEGAPLPNHVELSTLSRKKLELVAVTLRPRLLLHALLSTAGYRRLGLLESLLSLITSAQTPLTSASWHVLSSFLYEVSPTKLEWERIRSKLVEIAATFEFDIDARMDWLQTTSHQREPALAAQHSASRLISELDESRRPTFLSREFAETVELDLSPLGLEAFVRLMEVGYEDLVIERVAKLMENGVLPHAGWVDFRQALALRLSTHVSKTPSTSNKVRALLGRLGGLSLDFQRDEAQQISALEHAWDRFEEGTPIPRGELDSMLRALSPQDTPGKVD